MSLKTILKRSDFLNVSAKGKKFSTSTFIILAAENGLNEPRIGYTVTKKTSKLAVERNKIKRRLRAAVQEVMPNTAKAGFDYVLIGKKSVLEREFSALKGDLEFALRKMK